MNNKNPIDFLHVMLIFADRSLDCVAHREGLSSHFYSNVISLSHWNCTVDNCLHQDDNRQYKTLLDELLTFYQDRFNKHSEEEKQNIFLEPYICYNF